MRTVPLFSTLALLGSLIAASPVYAYSDFDGDWEIQRSRWDDDADRLPPPPPHHHPSSHRIEWKRAELHRDYEEQRRVWKAYEAARRAGDWRAVDYHRARLDRLDRKIQHDQRELEWAYAEARRDHGWPDRRY